MGVQDGLWIKKVMQFLDKDGTPRVWTDNRGALTLTQNPDFYQRTKHIRRRHHFIRECAGEGSVTVHWVSGADNPADVLTKRVSVSRINDLKRGLGMKDQEGVDSLGRRVENRIMNQRMSAWLQDYGRRLTRKLGLFLGIFTCFFFFFSDKIRETIPSLRVRFGIDLVQLAEHKRRGLHPLSCIFLSLFYI